jgi:hypothetical protein
MTMKRFVIAAVVVASTLASSGVAEAKIVDLTASPNPATLGDRVRHEVSVGVYARLDVWVSASGFEQPGTGTLPPGAWGYQCCPSQTAGTAAWHYRSNATVVPGTYRFGAVTRARGQWLSSALVGGTLKTVWIAVR